MASDPPDDTAPTVGAVPAPPEAELHAGARFVWVRRLGRGGMGVVHEVYDRERHLRVALKSLQELNPRQVLRLKDEFRTLRDLSHPNLVRLGELIEDGGRWCFTMELVDGCDLLTWVAGQGGHADSDEDGPSPWPSRPPAGDSEPTRRLGKGSASTPSGISGGGTPPPGLPPAPGFHEGRLRDALGQLAAGLAFLHEAGVVHRDVKPSNVMVARDGRVVLLDFGVAAAASDAMRPSGRIVGTVKYMAPEQARGEAVGPSADWYAVGMLLFRALTGRAPFSGGSADDLLARKRLLEAPRPSQVAEGVPEDLDELCARLLAQDPASRPGAAEVLAALGVDRAAPWVAPSALAAPASPSFVGRQAELALLEAGLAATRAGRGVTALVEGASGVGKTALVDELVRRVAAADGRALILRGRCHERESVPYKAFDGVVDGLAKHLDGMSVWKAARLLPGDSAPLLRVFPALEAALPERLAAPREPPADAPAPELRERAFAALRDLLARLAARRALIVVIDDVQWADADSLDLLEALLRPPGAPPLFLALTARRGAGEPEPAAAARLTGDVRRVSLAGLGGEDALALARELATRTPGVDEAALVEVIRDADGHPLFIEELVRHSAAVGARRGAPLDEALRGRVARLPDATRGLLELVVVAGAPVPQEVVADAAGLAPEAYARELDDLRAGKLVRITGVRRRDAVEPFHDRVREAIYARIDEGRRRALHGALARALEGAGAAPELLAGHYEKSGDRAAAARHAEAGAVAASAALAFDRAAALYSSALSLGEHPPARRRALLAALGACLADAGRPRAAAEAFRRAAAVGEPAPGERLQLERRAAEQFTMGGHLAEGLAASRTVLEGFGEAFPVSRGGALARFVWARARLGLRRLTWRSCRDDELPAAARERLDMFWSVGAGLMMLDTVRGALFTTRGALLALDAGHDENISRFLCAVAMAEGVTGKRARVDRIVDACRRAADGSGSPAARFYAQVAPYARLFFLDNEWARTVAGMDEAARVWSTMTGRQAGWEADVVEQLRDWSLENLGRLREVRERVPGRIRAAERAGNCFIAVNFRTYFVHVHLVPDRPDDARRDVEDAIASWLPGSRVFGNQDYLALRSLTYIALYRGDVEARAAELGAAWRRFFPSLMAQLTFLRQDALYLTASLALARAVEARRRGAASEARALVDEAQARTRKLSRIGLPMAADYVSLLRCGLAAVTGGAELAVPLLRAALARSEARETALHAACLRRRLGEIVGGDEGRALVAASDAWMRAEEVACPARLVAANLPGWEHPG